MQKKKNLGQFFTTNSDKILQGFENYIQEKNICDPFSGAGDLLNWAKRHGAASVAGYDIDPHYADGAIIRLGDSLREARSYEFVLTNPPYLYQNKMHDNSLLKTSRHTDLYQLALEKLLNAQEGIAIVPVNFLSADNAQYIRQQFLDIFAIDRVNYFTEQVFSDTTYTVIAFHFKRKAAPAEIMKVEFNILPEGEKRFITLEQHYNWRIGGGFIHAIKSAGNKLHIKRLEERHLQPGTHEVTLAYNHIETKRQFKVNDETYKMLRNNILLLRAIDTGRRDGGDICLEDIRAYGVSGLVSLPTSRNQISLLLPPEVTTAEQERLMHMFNAELKQKREEYFSLFMTNYRDKNRKRISFNFAYNLLNYLYSETLHKNTARTVPAPERTVSACL